MNNTKIEGAAVLHGFKPKPKLAGPGPIDVHSPEFKAAMVREGEERLKETRRCPNADVAHGR